MNLHFLALGLWCCAVGGPALLAGERDLKVLNDRDTVLSLGYWIYNDLPQGFAEAKRTGKPLLVVLRCIP